MLVVIVLLLLAAAAIGAGLLLAWRKGDAGILEQVGARAADEREHARLHNVVDGLCLAAGVPKPALYVVDDPAPNSLVTGTGAGPGESSLVMTTGLLDSLSRIELEGVVAHQLVRIKGKEMVRPTFAANLPGPFAFLARSDDPAPALVDVAAVSLTRYPPGLLAALEKMNGTDTQVRGASPTFSRLWLVPPGTHLEERIDALREL